MSSYFLHKAEADEDAVTGVFADLLRAYGDPALLAAVLADARRYPAHHERIALPHFDDMAVLPWAAWDCGEPDLVLVCNQQRPVFVIVIEAKLGAPKSGTDAEDGELTIETEDQLAKYALEAARRWPGVPVTVLYLTHHAARPTGDLEESHRVLSARAPDLKPLAWFSWHDVEAALRTLAIQRAEKHFDVVALGLAEVLRGFGLRHFTGRWWPADAHELGELPATLWWSSAATPATKPHESYLWHPDVPPVPAPPVRIRPYRWTAGPLPPVPRFYRSAP